MAGSPSKWQDTHYHRAFSLAKGGASNNQIAQALGTTLPTFQRWVQDKPALAQALTEARAGHGPEGEESFAQYVFGHLPGHLQEVWQRIMDLDELGAGPEHIDKVLFGGGKRMRQHMFIQALVHTTWNVSKAMRMVNLDRKTFDMWCTNDHEFQELFDEIEWHKKNFFESALIDLVRQGDPAAVLFVNRTKNADRGYSDKATVEHKHTHTGVLAHVVEAVPVDSLGLSFDERVQLLERMRASKAAQAGLPAPTPIHTTATPAAPQAADQWDS